MENRSFLSPQYLNIIPFITHLLVEHCSSEFTLSHHGDQVFSQPESWVTLALLDSHIFVSSTSALQPSSSVYRNAAPDIPKWYHSLQTWSSSWGSETAWKPFKLSAVSMYAPLNASLDTSVCHGVKWTAKYAAPSIWYLLYLSSPKLQLNLSFPVFRGWAWRQNHQWHWTHLSSVCSQWRC